MQLLFYFDVVCPYAYLAFTQVEQAISHYEAMLCFACKVLDSDAHLHP